MMEIYLGGTKVEKYNSIGLWLWSNTYMGWQYNSETFMLTLNDLDATVFKLKFGL